MREGRFGFEETAYLLLFGALPTREQLSMFQQLLIPVGKSRSRLSLFRMPAANL